MRPTFRILALTAALSALAPAAFAAQVRLNFDDLGAQAEKNNAPVEVDVLDQLKFQGAFGYGRKMLDANADPENLDFATLKDGGFLLNRQRGQKEGDIIITLAPQPGAITKNVGAANTSNTASQFFEAITFNLFTKGIGNDNWIIATGSNGDEAFQVTSGGQDTWTTKPQTFTFDPLNEVTSLRFTASGAAFGLDDMVVTLTDPGNNVPEPASFALVGLALLAAGAARRRQRG